MKPSRVRSLTGACLAGLGLVFHTAHGQGIVPAVPGVAPVPVAPPTSVPTPILGISPATSVARSIVSDPAWSDTPLDTRPTATPHAARLINVSVRASAGTPAMPLIAGAAITGDGTLPLLVRAIGPGLSSFGVPNALPVAPDLTVFSGTTVAATTNTVARAALGAATAVGAFPATAPAGPAATGDAALVGRPAAGTVTAQCTSNESGSVLLEVYDAGAGAAESAAHLANVSCRGALDSSGVLVLGFVVSGEGQLRLLLRGVGPGLQQFGVNGTLSDPKIALYSGQTLIASNDNWQSGASAADVAAAAKTVGAFTLTSPNEAALIAVLPAGTYTLHVSSSTGATTGVALAELYALGTAATFDAATATNGVGLDLMRQLSAAPSPGNLILSPYSIESALALAFAGAAADTRSEMQRVLGLPADNATLQTGFSSLQNALATMAANTVALAQSRSRSGTTVDPIQWNVANRMFGQQGYPFRSGYVDLLRDGFGAPLQPLDFLGNADTARVTINDWVAVQTHNRILDVIPHGGVTSDTRLALVNALYLKAPWNVPFEARRTSPQPFHLTATTSRNVPMMQRTDYLPYAKEANATVVALDYLGQDLQYVIVLPDAGTSVDTLLAQLTPTQLARWAALPRATPTYVDLALPKFTVAGDTLPLSAALKALGMKTAFNVPPGSANFDGIAPRVGPDPLALSDVFHKTFVAVDEQGTEAAAATAVIAGTTSVPVNPTPIEVRVDRPFLFAIQQRSTGVCLFLGRITDPQ